MRTSAYRNDHQPNKMGMTTIYFTPFLYLVPFCQLSLVFVWVHRRIVPYVEDYGVCKVGNVLHIELHGESVML